MRLSLSLSSVAFALCALGCMPIRYVTQAAAGQAELLDGKRDIDEVVREGGQDARTRRLLARVAGIKAFGERRGLAATKNYTTFVDLHRDAVVWVVSASAPLDFRSVSWKFPITGSITYLGWFHRDDAEVFAKGLRAKGLDVDLRGAAAYSTLGWFADPVLSSMIWDGDEALGELADVILHESLHATYFVPSQSILNESVAAFVGNHLALEYLDQVPGSCTREKDAYVKLEAEAAARSAAMKAAFFELRALYMSSRSDRDKLGEKARILQRLKKESRLKRPVNNATLIQYETYGSGDAELAQLLTSCQGSWPRFLRTLESWRSELAKNPEHSDPALLLRPLLPRGCAH